MKRQLIVFKVGQEEFALDILLTKEILVMGNITPVPETEDYVEGVMNLRGNLVPVLDFRKRLRARKIEQHNNVRIIIARLENKLVGLIVDDASEVIKVTDDLLEPAPDIISEMGVEYVSGIVNLNNRFITLVDLRKALTEEIFTELDEVMTVIERQREVIEQRQLA
ncbi:MAG: chemotaxis protein CheW [Acidobacteriota bacterium]